MPTPDHADSMDAIYRTQRHIYDLTRKYYLLGRDRLIADLAPPPGGLVLEMGCGTARNLIVAARRYPHARFLGFDISEAMLENARTSIRRAGLEERIGLTRGDATSFSPKRLFGLDRVDRVFCSYTLSMIPGWEQALAAGADALAPGGRLHLVDFGDQNGLPDWFARGLHGWLDRFHVSPRADLEAVARHVAHRRGLLIEHRNLYRGYAQYAVIGG
ncbi:class I SAM-dependent methyltransferase [Blastomonas sp.]|uniref:class I SAM-dependent methyltransferase n=1 Tax=Blastomonas sp. TaxID=1909299 RepID=UPI0026151A12|nr:class I SAM-dependent methyltransferase [Blastomonas sp.]MDM7956301.1 class I SAM-dependent methyltransferase [Blastomonas sp.]